MPVVFLYCDKCQNYTGIYNFDAIAYESIMLGLYSVWKGPENGVCAKLGIQKKNEIFLGYSRRCV